MLFLTIFKMKLDKCINRVSSWFHSIASRIDNPVRTLQPIKAGLKISYSFLWLVPPPGHIALI